MGMVVPYGPMSRARAPRAGTSRFKGVGLCSSTQRWRVSISDGRRTLHVGRYETEEYAARIYDAAALILFGESVHQNFGPPPPDLVDMVRARLEAWEALKV